jgi:amino acid permease
VKNKVETVRNIYLYLISLAGILMIIFGLIGFVNQLLTQLIPQTVSKGAYDYSYYYSIQGMVRSITFVFLGVALFAYHWRLIVREHRIGRRDIELENETSMNFFEALFFYIVSFIGIMVLSFAFASFVSNFFYVQSNYTVPASPNEAPVELPPYFGPDVLSIVQDAIAAVIGAVVWLLAFAHVQNSYKKELPPAKDSEGSN